MEIWDYIQLGAGGLTGAAAAFAVWFGKMFTVIWFVPTIPHASLYVGGIDGIVAAISAVGAYIIEQPFFRGLMGGLTVGEIISVVYETYVGLLPPEEAGMATATTLKALGIEVTSLEKAEVSPTPRRYVVTG